MVECLDWVCWALFLLTTDVLPKILLPTDNQII